MASRGVQQNKDCNAPRAPSYSHVLYFPSLARRLHVSWCGALFIGRSRRRVRLYRIDGVVFSCSDSDATHGVGAQYLRGGAWFLSLRARRLLPVARGVALFIRFAAVCLHRRRHSAARQLLSCHRWRRVDLIGPANVLRGAYLCQTRSARSADLAQYSYWRWSWAAIRIDRNRRRDFSVPNYHFPILVRPADHVRHRRDVHFG